MACNDKFKKILTLPGAGDSEYMFACVSSETSIPAIIFQIDFQEITKGSVTESKCTPLFDIVTTSKTQFLIFSFISFARSSHTAMVR